MEGVSRRTHPRMACRVPTRYAAGGNSDFMATTILNFSQQGLFMLSQQEVACKADVELIVVQPPALARDRKTDCHYLGEAKWCQLFEKNGKSLFGVGIALPQTPEDHQSPAIKELVQPCDLCGMLTIAGSYYQSLDDIYLCAGCHHHLNSMPKGMIKESIHNFLLGNVI